MGAEVGRFDEFAVGGIGVGDERRVEQIPDDAGLDAFLEEASSDVDGAMVETRRSEMPLLLECIVRLQGLRSGRKSELWGECEVTALGDWVLREGRRVVLSSIDATRHGDLRPRELASPHAEARVPSRMFEPNPDCSNPDLQAEEPTMTLGRLRTLRRRWPPGGPEGVARQRAGRLPRSRGIDVSEVRCARRIKRPESFVLPSLVGRTEATPEPWIRLRGLATQARAHNGRWLRRQGDFRSGGAAAMS